MNQTRNVVYERAVMAAIRHPFLLRLVNTYQSPSKLYMLTEYVHGGELFNLLGDMEVLPADHARFYAACTLSGLAHLHALGIVYRDLKPENLLIDRGGYIRIIDFGFCKYVGPAERTFTLCGTPAFLSPEMLSGRGYDHGADYWALGTLIAEMLLGYAPFEGEDQPTTFRNILHSKLALPEELEETDPHACDLIRQLLAKNVVDRLGCRRDGVAEIFSHPWFAAVDFPALLRRELPAPWLPELAADDDARYFEAYSDSEGEDEEEDGDADAGADVDGSASQSQGDGEDDEDEDADDGDAEELEGEDQFEFSESIPGHLVAERERASAAVRRHPSSASGSGSRSARSSASGGTASDAASRARRSLERQGWFDGF